MDTRLSLALKYYDSGLLDEAWSMVREVLGAGDPPEEVFGIAAAIGLEIGAYDEVVEIAKAWSESDPQSTDALVAEGQAYLGAGNLDAAGHVLIKAVNSAPENPNAQFNLGLWFQKTGRLNDAESAYRAATSVHSSSSQAWNNLGNVLDETGRPDEAITAFRTALSIQPDFSSAHNNLGAALAGQGQYVAASKSYEKAIEADPKNFAARVNLGVASLEQGDVQKSVSIFDDVLREDPGNLDAAHNRLYAKIYFEDDPAIIVAEHDRWGRSVSSDNLVQIEELVPEKCLRVGYVSPDFRRHSVSFFAEPLLKGHRDHNVEVFCYSDSSRTDDMTKRLEKLADNWRNVQGQDDNAVAQMIRNDRIDILVDLAGHTTGNRLSVFAGRAAPIQVTALGYPATTGVAAMDYRLCDAVTDPSPASDAWSTETLLRLSGGLHCFQPPEFAGACDDPPVMKNGFVTFGSFNKLAKVSPFTIKLWADVLKAVPDSRLLLKSKPLAEKETQDRVCRDFEECGIAPERLELMGWIGGDHDHLEAYNKVDIALDTFPYNGTTTTCEALWMGVPVVTLAGKGHAARVGASILTQVGMQDLIVSDSAQYVVSVREIVNDIEKLKSIRQSLRARMKESSLCDWQRYGVSIDAAYRTAWSALCAAR